MAEIPRYTKRDPNLPLLQLEASGVSLPITGDSSNDNGNVSGSAPVAVGSSGNVSSAQNIVARPRRAARPRQHEDGGIRLAVGGFDPPRQGQEDVPPAYRSVIKSGA